MNVHKYPQIAARILSTPLLMEASYASVFFSALLPRMGIDALTTHEGVKLDATTMEDTIQAYKANGKRPYQLSDGVAIVPIDGSLTYRNASMNPVSGSTGYDGIAAQLQLAAEDPNVKGVLLDVSSPGGEASGVATVGDQIRNFPKPVWTHTGQQMASAAYWLGSSARKVYADQMAQVGSIGAVVATMDSSGALEKSGVKVELIRFGSRKAELNGMEPITPEARTGIQTQVDELGTLFASAVASNRKLPLEKVLATEAAMFTASQAKELGLIDGVASLSDTLKLFKQSLNAEAQTTAPKTNPTTTTQTTLKVKKMNEENTTPAQTEAQTEAQNLEAASAERQRIQSIIGLNHPGANHIAFNTDMSVEAATALLSAIPVAPPVAAQPSATPMAANPTFNGVTLAQLSATSGPVKPEVGPAHQRTHLEAAAITGSNGQFDLNKMVAAVTASNQAK